MDKGSNWELYIDESNFSTKPSKLFLSVLIFFLFLVRRTLDSEMQENTVEAHKARRKRRSLGSHEVELPHHYMLYEEVRHKIFLHKPWDYRTPSPHTQFPLVYCGTKFELNFCNAQRQRRQTLFGLTLCGVTDQRWQRNLCRPKSLIRMGASDIYSHYNISTHALARTLTDQIKPHPLEKYFFKL